MWAASGGGVAAPGASAGNGCTGASNGAALEQPEWSCRRSALSGSPRAAASRRMCAPSLHTSGDQAAASANLSLIWTMTKISSGAGTAWSGSPTDDSGSGDDASAGASVAAAACCSAEPTVTSHFHGCRLANVRDSAAAARSASADAPGTGCSIVVLRPSRTTSRR